MSALQTIPAARICPLGVDPQCVVRIVYSSSVRVEIQERFRELQN